MKIYPPIAGLVAMLTLSATPAHAGCGLTVTFDNDTSRDITVQQVEAKITGGNYATVHSADFNVPAGKKVSKAIETQHGCTLPHHLRAKYQIGGSTKYATKGPLATAFDKKITLEMDN